jgi:16S rRNA processing protein RimM
MAEWIALGGIVRSRGNRGEVVVDDLTTGPARFLEVRRVSLLDAGGSVLRELEIENAWSHQGATILKFRGIDTISEAEELRGKMLVIPASSRRTLPEDEFFLDDLIGCEVVEAGGPRQYGRVAAYHEQPGGTGLLELETGMLIPMAKSICRGINPAERRIEVNLPEGLADLNREP